MDTTTGRGIRRAGIAVAAGVLALGTVAACSSDERASAAFTAPADGERLAGAVRFALTADGIDIEPAGTVRSGGGHFHVIADQGCVTPGEAIARDADHVHLGGGQSEGVIHLEPGRHDLCLQIGDGGHTALAATDRVTVDVGIDGPEQWCAVIDEVDRLFEEIDARDDAFSAEQVAYEDIRRLLAQLSAAIDLVDTGARDDVHALLALAANVASAVVTASDQAAADEAVEQIFDDAGDRTQDDGLPGADWIHERCGVDV